MALRWWRWPPWRECTARRHRALEINSHPARLDLPSAHIRAARDAGVKFAIDTDPPPSATRLTHFLAKTP
jgi:hypothetical protein